MSWFSKTGGQCFKHVFSREFLDLVVKSDFFICGTMKSTSTYWTG